jgi:hypothetical protein
VKPSGTYGLGDIRSLDITLSFEIPICAMRAQDLPAKQETEDRHDGPEKDTRGDQNNACDDERHADEHLLPRFCVYEEPANDRQQSAVHFTPSSSTADTSSLSVLRGLELLSEWPRVSRAQPNREVTERAEDGFELGGVELAEFGSQGEIYWDGTLLGDIAHVLAAQPHQCLSTVLCIGLGFDDPLLAKASD